jgi:hypothetical protein
VEAMFNATVSMRTSAAMSNLHIYFRFGMKLYYTNDEYLQIVVVTNMPRAGMRYFISLSQLPSFCRIDLARF